MYLKNWWNSNHAEDLNLVILMYKLIEYSSNYSEITGSLWFYCKDEATDFNDNIANSDVLILSCIKLYYWESLKLMEQKEF